MVYCLTAHQTITWTNIDYSLVRFCGIQLRAISQRVPKLLFCIMNLKMSLLKLQPLLTFTWSNKGHYNGAKMSAMASKITGVTLFYSTVYSGTDQRKHQSSASLASVQGIHRWPVNSPHKWPVTRKMFPFDDVILYAPNFMYFVPGTECESGAILPLLRVPDIVFVCAMIMTSAMMLISLDPILELHLEAVSFFFPGSHFWKLRGIWFQNLAYTRHCDIEV